VVPSALSFHTTGPVVFTTTSPNVAGAAAMVLEVGFFFFAITRTQLEEKEKDTLRYEYWWRTIKSQCLVSFHFMLWFGEIGRKLEPAV
jgi:hypothetical protein